MLKYFFLSMGLLAIGQYAYALSVVYPKQENVIINSPSTFFVGASDYNQPLTINDEAVDVHPSGGFAKTVPLNFGENVFILKSGSETFTYTITRPSLQKIQNSPKINDLKLFDTPMYLEVSKDNVPLRSTPIDEGINRLSHLQAGIPLIADGEKNGFYRIRLGENTFGWILKSNVSLLDGVPPEVSFLGADVDADDEFFFYTFHLSSLTPYSIEEIPENLRVSFYNISSREEGVYSVDLPLASVMNNKNLLGYGGYFSGNNFVLKVRKPLISPVYKPLNHLKIAIDAGHGGSESGAISCFGIPEKKITLQYAKDLSSELKSRGAEVVLVRDKDETIDLKTRVESANNENSVILISLHGNALPDSLDPSKIKGTEIYYYYPQAKPLAESIMKSLVSETGTINNGIIQRSFALVRNTNALSILIEIGYLINPDDNAKIMDKNYRKKTAKAIADGMEQYIKTQLVNQNN